MSTAQGNELGTLIVVVLKARNLKDDHSFYKQDVFAQASLNGATKRTHIDVKGGQHPVWDAELRFPIMKNTAEKYRKLEVACYCKESKTEDLLGNGVVDITETLKTGEFDDWLPLNINGVVRGDLYLEMTFYANTPPPVTTTAVHASGTSNAARPGGASLAVLTGDSSLSRRPSKLSQSERLYRLPQNLTSSSARSSHIVSNSYKHPGNNLSPGGELLRPSSAALPKRSESPLPPLPGESSSALPLPQTLIPRGDRASPRPSDQPPPQVPAILRPRHEISSSRASSQVPSTVHAYESPLSLPYPGDYNTRASSPQGPPTEHSATPPHVNYYASPASTTPAMSYAQVSPSHGRPSEHSVTPSQQNYHASPESTIPTVPYMQVSPPQGTSSGYSVPPPPQNYHAPPVSTTPIVPYTQVGPPPSEYSVSPPHLNYHAPPASTTPVAPYPQVSPPQGPPSEYSVSPPRLNYHAPPVSKTPVAPYPQVTPQQGLSSEQSVTPPHVNYYVPPASTIPTVSYPPNPQQGPAGIAPAVLYPLSTSPQPYGPNPAPSSPISISFPVPNVAPRRPSSGSDHSVIRPPSFSYRLPDENNIPDPYLQARYQTPLPLPQDCTSPDGNRTEPSQSNNNNDHINALRLKEEEKARQKAQEDKDRELALQLDRELNLDD